MFNWIKLLFRKRNIKAEVICYYGYNKQIIIAAGSLGGVKIGDVFAVFACDVTADIHTYEAVKDFEGFRCLAKVSKVLEDYSVLDVLGDVELMPKAGITAIL